MAVCVGAGLLILDMFLSKKREDRVQKTVEPATEKS
jgi:hypothetical protein